MVRDRQINVFISSSMTELEYDREIAEEVLTDMIFNPILFELFPAMNMSPSESYTEGVRDCDVFLLLLWKSLSSGVQEEYNEAVKRSKPILMLVKSLAGNEKRTPKLTTFLKKFDPNSRGRPPRRVTYHKYRSVAELKTAVRESVAAEIAKFYREPVYTMARNEMYELGTSIIQYAQRRLYVFQRTPSLILGARPYIADDSKKYAYEREFADVLKKWIGANYELADKEFVYLFSAKATKKEIRGEPLKERVKDNVRWLKKIEVESGHRFRIETLDVPMSGPLIVGDNRYAIWVLGEDQAVSISQENKGISDILVMILNSYSQKHLSNEEMLSVLGL
ncbi:MAG: DUF4062 domain-containing protein [Desulfobacteria bacterium]